MVQPPPTVVLGEVRRAVAPPGVQPLGRWMEMTAEIDPVMALLEAGQGLDLHRSMADDIQQLLVAPDIAFEWRDVEIADHDRRAGARLGPAGHPFEEVEFLAELGIDRPVRRVAAGRNIDILQPNARFK